MTMELMQEFSVGGAALGFLSGMYFYTYAALQLPVGMLNDKFGPRKLMTVALVVCAGGSLLFSYSDSLVAASLSRALIGGAVAFAFVGTLTIATTFFAPGRFAMLAGILMSVGMIGAIVGQAPLRLLMEQTGWRMLFQILAFVALLLSMLIWFLVPKRPQVDVIDNQADSTAVSEPSGKLLAGLGRVVRNRQTWLCAVIGFGLSATMLGFSGLWAVPWLMTHYGFGSSGAAATASLLFVGVACGSPIMGWYSDRVGKRKPILLAGTFCLFVFVCILFYGRFESVYVLSGLFFLVGLASAVMGVAFGLTRELNSPQVASTALGLVNMFVVGAGAVMQPLIGWLLDLGWRGMEVGGGRVYPLAAYDQALSSLAIVALVSFLCALLVKESGCKAVPK